MHIAHNQEMMRAMPEDAGLATTLLRGNVAAGALDNAGRPARDLMPPATSTTTLTETLQLPTSPPSGPWTATPFIIRRPAAAGATPPATSTSRTVASRQSSARPTAAGSTSRCPSTSSHRLALSTRTSTANWWHARAPWRRGWVKTRLIAVAARCRTTAAAVAAVVITAAAAATACTTTCTTCTTCTGCIRGR